MSSRGMPRPRLAAILLVLGTSLSACASLFGPDVGDVSLVGVDVIADAPDGATDLRDLYFARDPNGRLVKVRLAAKVDLAALRGDEIYLNSRGALCPLDHGPRLSRWPPIHEIYYGRSIRVDELARSYREHPERKSAKPEDGLYRYDVFFELRRTKPESSNQDGNFDLQPYDLAATPQDVCLELFGSMYYSLNVESNTVIVSSQAIADALRRTGAP